MAANGGGGIKNDEESFDSNKQILLIENDDEHHRRRRVQLINNNNNHNNNNNNNDNNNNNNNKGGGGGGIISIAERRAAKCGFNASSITADRFRPAGLNRSQPYFTVPPGISPSALLDSPVMLPNVQAQLSPTTGTFQFPSPTHENESLRLNLKLGSNGNETMSMESSSLSALRVDNMPLEEFEMSKMEECFEDKSDDDQVLLGGKKSAECLASSSSSKNTMVVSTTGIINNNPNNNNKSGSSSSSSSSIISTSKEVGGGYKYSEDGFLWRKYGQKHVKGSEFPRSYYKCTNSNCVVRKKVERSHDGQITEIVYRGSHNHPKPPPHNFKRSLSSSDQMTMMETTTTTLQAGWRSPPPPTLLNDFPPLSNNRSLVDFSSTFVVQNEASPESISFNDDAAEDDDDENAHCDEPKKRKRGDTSIPNETAVARSTREPKVVVQIESEIDILDDGYRWRKYGQKVVKGNPNPRSYYKCTTPGCPVRKHVERAANDIKSVITTYEGKHNHQVPSTKTAAAAGSSLVIHSDHHHHHHHVANNNNNNNNLNPNGTVTSTMPHKPPDHAKLGRQVQEHLPMFMDRKPILTTYNELMMRTSNQQLPPAGNFNFGTTTCSSSASSTPYPVSFPPFNSLPYSSLLMNNNRIKTIYPFSKTYPTVSDYVNHVLGSANTTLAAPAPAPAPANNNFHYNNSNNNNNNNNSSSSYIPAAAPLVQTSSTPGHEMMIDCHLVVKPKEEQRDDQVFENCLPLPNHGNGTI